MPSTNRTFRVFVSSTFEDMRAERDALRKVFKALDKRCRTHGFRFQGVDLRHGISMQESHHQQTMAICLEEIARCRRTSARPNFIFLLGQRYGWRPLPDRIPASTMTRLTSMPLSREERDRLHRYYRQDSNALPPVYRLQSQDPADDAWPECEQCLRSLFDRAAQSLNLTDAEKMHFCASATEQEIVNWALMVADASSHVYGFVRHIDDLPHNQKAATFRDTLSDSISQDRLAALKERLNDCLAGNLLYYRSQWTGDATTTDHIARLCSDAKTHLERVILSEIEQRQAVSTLAQEIGFHREFGRARTQGCIQRVAALETIIGYCRADGSRHPLAILGEGGVGKTTLMAEAALTIERALDHACVVFRFIGATGNAGTVRQLLASIGDQISHDFARETDPLPEDDARLHAYFLDLLNNACTQKPLIVLLDALDQLDERSQGQTLDWLPTELPAHARLVVSSLTKAGLAVLKRRIPESNLTPLEPMEAAQTMALLEHRLDIARRTLTDSQWEALGPPCRQSGLPLFAHLAAEEALRWTSYSPLVQLPPTVGGLFRYLFKRLADPARPMLVERSLAYLAAARNGLTDSELLAVLSRDDAVMDEFRRGSYASQDVKRLPAIVWSRLYFDLEPYLAERSVDGTETLTFFHRQMAERVIACFLDEPVKPARHGHLATVFANQPNALPSDGSPTPNLRKLSELPYQWIHAGQIDDLNRILTDFEFVHLKIKTMGTQALIDDYDRAISRQPAGALTHFEILRDLIRRTAHILDEDPDQLAGQLLGRLLDNPSRHIRRLLRQAAQWRGAPWLHPLMPSLATEPCRRVRQFKAHDGRISAIAGLPGRARVLTAGEDRRIRVWDWRTGALIRSLDGHEHKVKVLAASADERYAVSGSYDRTLILWDLNTYTILARRSGHDAFIIGLAIDSPRRRMVSVDLQGGVRLWDIGDPANVSAIASNQASDQAAEGDTTLSAEGRGRLCLNVWDILEAWDAVPSSGLQLWSDSDPALISAGGRYAVIGLPYPDTQTIALWDRVDRQEIQRWKLDTRHNLTVAVSPDNRQLLFGTLGGRLTLWDIRQRRTIDRWQAGAFATTAIWFSPDGATAVTGDEEGALQFWNLEQAPASDSVAQNPRTRLAALSDDGSRALSVEAGPVLKRWRITDPIGVEALFVPEGYEDMIDLLPDPSWVISRMDGALVAWDIATRRDRWTWSLPAGVVQGPRFTPDGRTGIVATIALPLPADSAKRFLPRLRGKGRHPGAPFQLLVWNVCNNEPMATIAIDDLDPGLSLEAVSLSPGGSHAAVLATNREGEGMTKGGTARFSTRVYRLANGEMIDERSHEEFWEEHYPSMAIAVADDGRVMHARHAAAVSAHHHRAVRADGDRISVGEIAFQGIATFLHCGLSADGNTVLAVDDGGRLHLLRVEGL